MAAIPHISGERRSHRDRPRASALITTLLVTVVLTIIVTAFMQSMTVERQTARSYLYRYQAELAVNMGIETIKTAIQDLTETDTFLVVRNGDYFYLGSPQPGSSATVRYLPLFSSTSTLAGLFDEVTVSATQLPKVPVPSSGTTELKPQAGNIPPVRVSWVNFPTEDTPTARFAYWIEDLQGYVDASIAGNLDNSGSHDRTTGKNPKEVALFTLFDKTADRDPGNTPASEIIPQQERLLTAETVYQAADFPDEACQAIKGNIVAGIPNIQEVETIPFGFGYPDEGKPKYELNEFVRNGDVEGLAFIIKRNLPGFDARKGGFRDDYFKTIAANIIGYANPDVSKIVGSGYRGAGHYPLVNEFAHRYQWTGMNGTKAIVAVTSYIELWNPYDIPVSGKVEFTSINRQQIEIGAGSHRFNEEPKSGGKTFDPFDITIPPNGYVVKELTPKVIYEFETGTNSPASPAVVSPDSTSTYEMRWNGALVDKSNGGLSRQGGSLNSGSSNPRWSGTLPGFNYAPESTSKNLWGDPRISFYAKNAQAANNYQNNSSFGGRNLRASISGDPVWKEVKINQWPDSGHNSQAGKAAGSLTRTPVQVEPRPNEPDKAPFRLSDKGEYESMAELGHVFDPIQWRVTSLGSTKEGMWTDLPKSGSVADDLYGGAVSLRIGRPEFTKFNQNGTKALQLLDLFTVTPKRKTKGLINLNTASRDVLRSLVAGLSIASDKAIQPATVHPPKKSDAGDLFADAIMASRPFLSTSQLAEIRFKKDSTNHVDYYFGVRSSDHFKTDITEWTDSAAEEFFARSFDLTAVRSRNFRVYLVGQAIGPKGRIVSTVRRTVHLAAIPRRNEAGEIAGQDVRVTYQK